jgi:hypothetical protein
MQQSLTDCDKDRRIAFYDSFRQYFEDSPNVIHLITFGSPTKRTFTKTGTSINRICVYRALRNPTVMETPLHPQNTRRDALLHLLNLWDQSSWTTQLMLKDTWNSFKTTLFILFKAWEWIWKKHFSNNMRQDHIWQIQFSSLKFLKIPSTQLMIVFLNYSSKMFALYVSAIRHLRVLRYIKAESLRRISLKSHLFPLTVHPSITHTHTQSS